MSIGVIGAGAFGTALAIAMASDGTRVRLWGRDPEAIAAMIATRRNAAYLPGVPLADSLTPTADLSDLDDCSSILLAVPAQQTAAFRAGSGRGLTDRAVVLCAKGIDLSTHRLQTELWPEAKAVLTGPGFADEIAAGLPTALTLAVRPDAAALQGVLARPTLRLYRTGDMLGAQLGGALKNVIAIAAGIAIGARLGESARAAIMTRGFAEMRRLAAAMGAADETLTGLSGLGDLALTCASARSRNFAHGLALGQRSVPASGTVEGVATARATLELATRHGVEMPVAEAVASVLDGRRDVGEAIGHLLSRPLKDE